MSRFERRAVRGWIGTLVWVALLSGDAVTSAAEGPQVLYLHTEFLPYARPIKSEYATRLTREYFRQAVLIAARDELGLNTRDETLQEEDPPKGNVVHVMPIGRGDAQGKWRLKLISADDGLRWEQSYEFCPGGMQFFSELATKLEAETRGSLLEGLRSVGVAGSRPALGNATPPGAEVEALLLQPDCVAQYSVVRAAHQALAEHGETSEWLGVLVRGYANLALLTRHYWNAVPEVFTARAWLYAQRLAAKTDSSDIALWHRAYAWAWGGTLPLAAADLDEVERRRNSPGVTSTETSTASVAPSWVKLTRAYSQFDRSAIQQVMDDAPALKPWGAVLRYTLSSFTHDERWILSDARQIAETCPQAYMVFGELAGHGSYKDLQVPEAMSATLFFSRGVPQAVASIPALPDSVKALIANQASPAESSSAPTTSGLSLAAFSPRPMELARQLRRVRSEYARGTFLVLPCLPGGRRTVLAGVALCSHRSQRSHTAAGQ